MRTRLVWFFSGVLLVSVPAQAGLGDFLKDLLGGKKTGTAKQGSALTSTEVVDGLKQALSQGARKAISNLGRRGGYLDNVRVRIPVPRSMRRIEKLLRRLGMKKYADRFVVSMNRAAEQAVDEAWPIIWRAVKNMSIRDAMNILRGPDDAATQYFRRTTTPLLTKKMLPLIRQATARVGVTGHYKKFVGKIPGASRYLDEEARDIDLYITRRALDGLFLLVADEEKRIRKDPVARTTKLLKKVFAK